jgi:hypothetical protein
MAYNLLYATSERRVTCYDSEGKVDHEEYSMDLNLDVIQRQPGCA